jgi:hypothetical protein
MRVDLSEQLVHLTRGTMVEAEQAFQSIVTERRLRGSNKNIRGGHLVVCFSEAPVDILARMFSGGGRSFRYRPFGIMVRKDWLFALGGRPVIYQPDDDYKLLPEPLQFRHVRFDEPGSAKDFTFEREWRICTESLILEPTNCTLVVPDREWDYRLRRDHDRHDMDCARAMKRHPFTRITNFDWHVLALGDLGAKFPINDSD